MSINICENQKLINKFEEKVATNEYKDLLVSILKERLNGNIVIGYNVNEDNLSFDFKDKLNKEQLFVLDMFTEIYHSFPLIKLEYMDIIEPIVSAIERNYINIKKFMNVIPEDLKYCLLQFNNYSKTQYKLNKVLELSLIMYKLYLIEEEIKKTYGSLLPDNFAIRDLINVNEIINSDDPISFGEFYSIIEDYIRCKLYKNIHIKENREKLFNLKFVLNRLFWIVYADDFKFIDNVQRMYLIDNDSIEEYQEQLCSNPNFICESSHMMENGVVEETKINVFENWSNQMIKVEENIKQIFDNTLKQYMHITDGKYIEQKLEEALDEYLKMNVTDVQEFELYRSLFAVNLGFAMLGRGMTLLEDVFKTIEQK